MISIKIKNVQHIDNLEVSLDLSRNGITCIVGKNGAGKTTLIKAIRNICISDTFIKTSPREIFSETSEISYNLEGNDYIFDYDRSLRTINSKNPIPERIKSIVDVELPIPFGIRFNFFQNISTADKEIRRDIILQKYSIPSELIDFMSFIYQTDKFKNLVEIDIQDKKYYCAVLEERRYIREDYLSSGEYFLISLYRKIKSGKRLIVIDEIDISLDASAQARLVDKIRSYCEENKTNILFTTHSLAMMRTLNPGEILYMEKNQNAVEVTEKSYSYIKSVLFGFIGWDRYILTEDQELEDFVDWIISEKCMPIFYRYKIIHIGGASNVVSLMNRNSSEEFFSSKDNVVSILDGDQSNEKYSMNRDDVIFIPIESVEKEIFRLYESGELPRRLPDNVPADNARAVFRQMIRSRTMSRKEMYHCLYDNHPSKFRPLIEQLNQFLSR